MESEWSSAVEWPMGMKIGMGLWIRISIYLITKRRDENQSVYYNKMINYNTIYHNYKSERAKLNENE